MEKINLKKVITHNNKHVVYLIMTCFFLALYLGTGAISYQSGIVLPMPEFEARIPFMVWTIWIYIVLYPIYIFWSLYTYKNEELMNKTFYTFIFMLSFSCLCFVLFPVTYPREFFPLPYNDDFTTNLFRAMRAADKPSNCLPSLHVAFCYVLSFGHKNESKLRFMVSFFISTLISISTLTTKQHYIYDIVTGFALAYFLYLFFHKLTKINQESSVSYEDLESNKASHL